MISPSRTGFWREAFAFQGSVTPYVLPRVFVFGLVATVIVVLSWLLENLCNWKISLEVAPYEIAGAALGLLLILRTNAGYDRWWEARKLWGGIVNQCRNLIISALSYGPANPEWREKMVRWTAAFPHVARCSLRGEKPSAEITTLLGQQQVERLAAANHMPSLVAMKLAECLREACDRFGMDRFAFMQVDRERAALIDHIGACERILKTPLPRVYGIKIRRFIALFLITLPFALLHRVQMDWLVPIITMLVAYPLVSLDQIGIELQNPFSARNLSHLPLEDMSATIEVNLMGLLKERQGDSLEMNEVTARKEVLSIPSG